jgi:hypothetical protein
MSDGSPISRTWVVTLMNETVVIDWGDDIFQDIITGDFFHGSEADIAHTVYDAELDMLKRTGHILWYNEKTVFTSPLPEPPRRTIE